MPPEPEKNMEFADETINTAGAIAAGQGKSNFEKQKEIIAQSIASSGEAPTEQPQAPHVVIKHLRTFQGDVAEAIKHQNASVVSIALAEKQKESKQEKILEGSSAGISQNEIARIMGKKLPPGLPVDKRPVPPPPISTPPPVVKPKPVPVVVARRADESAPKVRPEIIRNSIMVGVSIVLIIVGIGAVAGFYILGQKPKTVVIQAPIDQTIISFNTKEEIPIANQNKDELLTKISSIRNSEGKQDGSITYIALTKTEGVNASAIRTGDLFALLNTSIPGSALRSFDDQFMLGIYTLNGNQPFLLIKLNSFDNAFAGMLAWEKTLNKDLGALFSARSIPITSQVAGPTGSSTYYTQVINVDAQINGTFEDVTIQNKDARVLKNVRGEDIILYSFLDNKTLLITSNEQIFHEILNKYIAQKLIR